MSEENLTDMLDDKAGYLAYMRNKTIEKLSERTHLTLEKISKLVAHEKHGPIVKDITLAELIDAKVQSILEEHGVNGDDDEVTEETAEAAPPRVARRPKAVKETKKKTAKKTAKKTPTKKAASKAPTKTKKKASVATKKASSGGSRKSDFGKKKPRLNREQGYKEILAALKAAGEPCGRGALEEATGYSGVQVRTFCKELAEQNKVKVLGSGGRSTKYEIA